jgi:CO dehydrogenase nickel-insertion accessory protein CooC1
MAHAVKIVVVGDGGVGKASLISGPSTLNEVAYRWFADVVAVRNQPLKVN